MTVIAAILFAAVQPAPAVVTVDVGGVRRETLVYAASGKAPAQGSPLVFGFHGHGGSMRNAASSFQMHQLWPEAVVVYPQGLPTAGKTDPKGVRAGWQLMRNDQEGRDLKFFDALLAKIRKDYRIDPKRIFTMGHSNGGRFTYVLWATRGDVFAAFAPSASPALGLGTNFKPRPAFVLAGESDELVPFANQKLTIDSLKRLLQCPSAPETETGYFRLYKGKGGIEFATYISPGGHRYMREANPLIAEFFRRQSL
jgi:polyhydroxybutyrate depolymerase